MKNLIIVTLTSILVTITALEYNADPFYDYSYREERSDKLLEDTEFADETYEYEKPSYDLKDAPELFVKFTEEYNKKYKNEADKYKHYENFVSNLKDIIRINKESKDSVADINMFADLGDEDLEPFTG